MKFLTVLHLNLIIFPVSNNSNNSVHVYTVYIRFLKKQPDT